MLMGWDLGLGRLKILNGRRVKHLNVEISWGL